MGFKSNATMDAKKAYCPGASGNLTKQYLIQDHMFAHYRKVFTAKAVVDTSAPKSLQCSVKYTDQKRRERLKRESSRRSLSARSLRSGLDDTRDSCSSKASRTSLQEEEDGCHYIGDSMTSSPRLNTSFHTRQIVYPSRRAATAGSSRNFHRSISEISYRDPKLQRQQSLRSGFGTGTAGGQGSFKAFQDPVQKTYSGDLMVKHSKHFTPEKPFTPRTLKKDSKSHLAQYRFYTPPRRKPSEEKISPPLVLQDSNPIISQAKQNLPPEWDLPQTFNLESELLVEENSPYRKKSKVKKTTSSVFLSSSRMSPDGTKSPIMQKVNAEEEELLYLEFIADVTNEILTLGLYSDRVMKKVFQRHIENNKHHLDEDKMRHLLDILHHDIQSPSNASTFCVHSTKMQKEEPFHFSNFRPEVTSKAKLGDRLSSSAMFERDLELRGQANPLLVSTPRSPTSNTSYGLGLETEDGSTKYSYSSYVPKRSTEKGSLKSDPNRYSSQVGDGETKMGRLKVVPNSYSLHDTDTEEESLKFDLTNYSSLVLDRGTGNRPLESSPPNYSFKDRETEDLLQFSPTSQSSRGLDAGAGDGPLRRSSTSYSSHGQDGRTEDGSLRHTSTSYSSHGPDAETDDDPQRRSPISYSSHGPNEQTEEGQRKQKTKDYLSSETEHNHLTPEENEADDYARGNNDLSAELEELGSNMESLHVSQTPSETVKDEQVFTVFSDDEF